MKIITDFAQIITLADAPIKGAMIDECLEPLAAGAIAIDEGYIVAIGKYTALRAQYPDAAIEQAPADSVLLPAFVDCHTHACFAGSRAADFAARNAGKSYLEIAQAGGGIWSSVEATRAVSQEDLTALTLDRVRAMVRQGITTIEIKSGYGLSTAQELKMLSAIAALRQYTPARIVPTCLAAHICPKDFVGTAHEYLRHILQDLLPQVRQERLSHRVDIFVERTAFEVLDAAWFLYEAQQMGFELTVHADQFTPIASGMASRLRARSADHLEASTPTQIAMLAASDTAAVVLPGASLGLGEPFAPARQLLDAGACLAIASDYNPGSAPMGRLLLQAAVLAAYQKLSTAEVLAALTYRAAYALGLTQVGKICPGYVADLQAYPCRDYREILYQQGNLLPSAVWIAGERQA